MNKMSKCSMLSLAVMLTACQTIPGIAVADNASAKAELKGPEAMPTVTIPAPTTVLSAQPAPAPAPAPAAIPAAALAPIPAPAPTPVQVQIQLADARSAPAPREEPVSMITPMAERQQVVRATGYAVISTQNHKNPAQQRLMAIRASKLDAYRALTEQVYGQQLDATTTVAEMMITSDTFRTRVQGIIYGAVLESITPIGDDTYETSMSLDGRVVNDLRVLYLAQLAARR